MQFIYNDGGRQLAGYKGLTGDCVTRSIAIITGKPYQSVYDEINSLSKTLNKRKVKKGSGKSSAREGVNNKVYHAYILSLGMKWTPTMFVGQGCKIHLRGNELPTGKLIVSVSGHMTAVIDRVIHDTHNPAREGMRCVYGYYSFDRY